MDRSASRLRAFTIVELLTVVTIIGLLAALLMPVFARSLNKSHQTTCLGNERQIGAAFNLYANDNDQYLPDQWSGRTLDPTTSAMTTDFETYLWPYTKSHEIFRCPSDTLSQPVVLPSGKTLFNSYSTPWNLEGKSLIQVAASSSTVLTVENMQLGDGLSVNWLVQQLGKASFTLDEGVVYVQPDFRHNDMGNYLFVDGHVKALPGPNPSFPGYKKSPQGVALCAESDPLPG